MGEPMLISLNLVLNKEMGYLVNLANPKSAILAFALCTKMLATLRSR